MSEKARPFKKLVITGLLVVTAAVSTESLTGCSHESLTPRASDVKASKEDPSTDCVSLGPVTGTTRTAKGTAEQALEDLKTETTNKGGNYVRVEQYSSYGTAVTGVAYRCK